MHPAAAPAPPKQSPPPIIFDWPDADKEIRPYVPRQPQDTLLYRVVYDHLDDFIALTEERYERPLPRYVVRAFRAYLECGKMERG